MSQSKVMTHFMCHYRTSECRIRNKILIETQSTPGPVYEFASISFHLGQIISNVLGQVNHSGQHGIAARTPIEPPVTLPRKIFTECFEISNAA